MVFHYQSNKAVFFLIWLMVHGRPTQWEMGMKCVLVVTRAKSTKFDWNMGSSWQDLVCEDKVLLNYKHPAWPWCSPPWFKLSPCWITRADTTQTMAYSGKKVAVSHFVSQSLSPSVHFHSHRLLCPFIQFHSLPSTFINLYPFPSTFINFNPMSSSFN